MNDDEMYDKGSILCATIPKTPKTLFICLEEMYGHPIKEICFQFKDEEIKFSAQDIKRMLRDFQHMYRDKI